jgi:hypothetical protein
MTSPRRSNDFLHPTSVCKIILSITSTILPLKSTIEVVSKLWPLTLHSKCKALLLNCWALWQISSGLSLATKPGNCLTVRYHVTPQLPLTRALPIPKGHETYLPKQAMEKGDDKRTAIHSPEDQRSITLFLEGFFQGEQVPHPQPATARSHCGKRLSD